MYVHIDIGTIEVKTINTINVPRNKVNMTTGSRVVFHMGPHKTGSTSIQAAINSQSFKNSLLLDKLVVGNDGPGGMTTKNALVDCFHNEQSCVGDSSNIVMKQMGKALTENLGIIFSSEQFDYTRGYLTEMKHFFHEFTDVQIILTYRRFFEWSLSWYMQSKRNSWEKWLRPKKDGSRQDHKNFATFLASTNLSSYATSMTRYIINPYLFYKDHFNVTLINMHAGNGDSLDNFFCNPVVNTPHTCKLRQRNELHIQNLNQMRGIFEGYDEIAVAAFKARLIDPRRISRTTARKLIRSHQEKILNLTAADFALTCPTQHQLNTLLEVSMKIEREYFPEFFESDQGEIELRKKFDDMVARSQFCSIDTDKVLVDPVWKKLFRSKMREKGQIQWLYGAD